MNLPHRSGVRMEGPMCYMGLDVYVHPLLGPRPVPIRQYKERKWTSKARVARLQKKWTKRYGTKIVDDILQTAQGFFMSPANFEKVKQAIAHESRS